MPLEAADYIAVWRRGKRRLALDRNGWAWYFRRPGCRGKLIGNCPPQIDAADRWAKRRGFERSTP